MAQGFKKTSNSSSKLSSRHKNGPKKGARIIKPKRKEAIQAASHKRKLTSEHIKQTEQQTVAKVGRNTFSLVKPDHANASTTK